MKKLVAYFSASGVTKAAAEKIAKNIEGDLFEIEPEVLYTSADLNWMDKNSRSTLEMKDLSSRPAIKKKILDTAQYDEVYIGFPVWWYTAPTIVNTFIESYDLTGKNVHVFVTSGGSTVDKSLKDLQNTYKNLAIVDGKRV